MTPESKPANLHGQIMNLPCDGATLDWANTREAYMYGHRDARHAAAELALAASAQAEANAKDAARYRWLRGDRFNDELPSVQSVAVGCIGVTLDGDALDAAIDAAMTAKDSHATD